MKVRIRLENATSFFEVSKITTNTVYNICCCHTLINGVHEGLCVGCRRLGCDEVCGGEGWFVHQIMIMTGQILLFLSR